MEVRGSIFDPDLPVRPLTDKEAARLSLSVCHLLTSGKALVSTIDAVLRMAEPHAFLIPMRQHRDEFVRVYNDAMQILGLSGGAHRASQDSNGGELAAPAAGQ